MENSVRTVKKKLLSSLFRESWVALSLSVLAVIAAIFFSYTIPYLSTFTLDYVIQGIPDSIPPFLLPAAERIGRAFWIRHLYLLGVILVLLMILRNLLPSDFTPVLFLMVYLPWMAYRGTDHLFVKKEKVAKFVVISSALLLGLPLVLNALLGLLII